MQKQAAFLHWMIFIVVVVVTALLLLTIPRNVANPLLLGMGSISIAAGIWTYRADIAHQIRHLEDNPLNRWWQRSIAPPLLARRDMLSRLLVAAGFLVMVLSVYFFTDSENDAAIFNGVLAFLCGIPLLILAQWLGPDEEIALTDPHTPTDIPAAPIWRRGFAALGLVGLAILAAASTIREGNHTYIALNVHVQFLLLVLSLLALAYGLTNGRWSLRDLRGLSRTQRLEIAFVTGLTLFGWIIRAYRPDGVRAFVDEVNFMGPTMYFWFESDVPLLQPMSSIAAFPYIFPYFQSIGIELFGRNLIGLRIASSVFGALTIPALYVLVRTLFNRPTAIIAALLLTTFPPHLQFSRIGLNNIADPLFGLLAIAFLVRGVKNNHPVEFMLAGMCLGLTHYFYEGGRLLFSPLLATWLVLMLFTYWRQVNRRRILLMIVTAGIVALPIYVTLVSMDRPLAHRIANIGLDYQHWESRGSLGGIIHDIQGRLRGTLLLFVSRREFAMYYAGDYPFFLYPLTPFLLTGLALVIGRWRRPGNLLLLIWIGATFFALTFLLRSSDSPRLLVIFPALIVVCAIGLYNLTAILLARFPGLARAVWVSVVSVIFVLQLIYYFGVHIERFNEQHYEHQPGQELAFAATKLPRDTHAYFISEPIISQGDSRRMVEYMADDIEVFTIASDDLTTEILEAMPPNRNLAFYFSFGEVETEALIQDYFGDVLAGPIPTENRYTAHIDYVLYFVDAENNPNNSD